MAPVPGRRFQSASSPVWTNIKQNAFHKSFFLPQPRTNCHPNWNDKVFSGKHFMKNPDVKGKQLRLWRKAL